MDHKEEHPQQEITFEHVFSSMKILNEMKQSNSGNVIN